MSNPGSAGAGRDGKLRELIAKWLNEAATETSEDYRNCLEDCADELAAILAVPDPLASDTGQGERPTLAQALERQVAMALRASEMAGMKPDEKAFYEGKAAGIRQALNSVRISASAPLASSSETQGEPRYFDEQGNYLDGPHYGKDCPKGKVQVAFLGADPKLQFSPYSWKPEDRVFIEISVDGEHWRIDIGDYEASCPGGKRRGLHINGPFDLCADKHSVNAVDLYRGKDEPASASPSDDGARQPVKPFRAHVLGCPKNFSVPVDLCSCGGRDVEHAAASDDGAAREPQDVPRFALRLVEKYSPEGVFQSVDLKRERHEHGEWVRWEDVEAELAAARARIVVLETSVDSLSYLIDHPVTPPEVSKKYSELLYAVSRVCPGESRHETALRYIRQAEQHVGGPNAVPSSPAGR